MVSRGSSVSQIGTSEKIVELLREVSLNEWVKKGYELHNDKREFCAFCGEIVSDERWSVLHKHFDDESRVLEHNIESLIKRIEIEIVRDGFKIDKNLFYLNFQKEIEQLSQSHSIAESNYNEQLKSIVKQLIKRKEAITVSLFFERPLDYTQEICIIQKSYEELRIQSNEFSGKLHLEQTRAKETLRLQEVYDFCSTINYNASLVRINEIKNTTEAVKQRVDKTQVEIRRIEEEIQEKKRQLNDEEKGALLVNKYLTDFFGHEFLSLRSTDDTRKVKRKFVLKSFEMESVLII
ncbi:AAA family ATPase [Paenibacillus agricola]|uniref:AAA family ATPase n=1 Tax=Paenibacillus agricola TaxID=2716264 RepID=A0ABX0JFN3_9BACL|nr:AAA family ATPase [Paenibacillus agricola]NHN34967.1 AAA family ATPase [Paenibacillus agricola]